MKERVTVSTFMVTGAVPVSGERLACSIEVDEAIRIATKRGYVKADPPKPAETEAEYLVRVTNGLPEAAVRGFATPGSFSISEVGGTHITSLDENRRRLHGYLDRWHFLIVGACSAFVATETWAKVVQQT